VTLPTCALFGRDQLPARSTLSRFLTALTAEPIDALRILFLEDLESRPLSQDKLTGGLVDRAGNAWVVFDVDGTREAARQRALPQTEALPAAFRRLDDVCAGAATRDWSRREHRRACMQLVRHQRIEVSLSPPAAASSGTAADVILSRAELAHSRLSWQERLARNARPPTAGHVTIKQIAHPGTLCCLPRVDDGLTPRLLASGFLLLGHLRHSEWHPMAFFPGSSSSSAFLAPHPADSSLSHRINVQF
jgi:hypothetical protein